MIKTNYHTHTQFCDGHNTAEEMVQQAISCGIRILGFSSHSMYPSNGDWHIASGQHQEYVNHIKFLKEKYSSSIEICIGFEADYHEKNNSLPSFQTYQDLNPDYLIGSVHYVPGKDGYYEADEDQAETRKAINKFFGGNIKEAVCSYFRTQREMLEKGNFTILGHCDLITKQNRKGINLFDPAESWYKAELKATADAIAKAGVIAEVNTGGMARSGMNLPYPEPYFLELLIERKIPLTINSDAHTASGIDYWFDQAVEYIKKAGCKELAYISNKTIRLQKI